MSAWWLVPAFFAGGLLGAWLLRFAIRCRWLDLD